MSYEEEYEKLKTQKIAFQRSYKQVYEENRDLKQENEQLKEELLQSDYVKASVLEDREEYKKQIVKLHEELKTMKLQEEE